MVFGGTLTQVMDWDLEYRQRSAGMAQLDCERRQLISGGFPGLPLNTPRPFFFAIGDRVF